MGEDMFDPLLRQEGTSPVRAMFYAPFVDGVVKSPETSTLVVPVTGMDHHAAAHRLGLPTQPRVSPIPKFYLDSEFQSEPIISQQQKNNNVQYCWLALDNKDVFVAMAIYHGMMRKGESLHNVVVGERKAKVSVVSTGERCETFALMIPTTEIPTLQNAIGSFISHGLRNLLA
ncbi:hypothetical protein ACFE04_011382 [Oxalis oulophora]